MKRSVTARLGLGLASIALGVLLIANFKAPEDIAVSGASTGGGSTGGPGATSTTGGSTAPGSTPAPNATSSSGSGGTTTGTKTLTGSLIQTRYGPVQVQITVSNGKITNIATPQLPSEGRSGRISQYAAPILTSETMAAQSAHIDLVSGATYTSDAYDQSLQAALDQAGI